MIRIVPDKIAILLLLVLIKMFLIQSAENPPQKYLKPLPVWLPQMENNVQISKLKLIRQTSLHDAFVDGKIN